MGTKEYHAQKSREWYERTKLNNPEKLKRRSAYTAKRRTENKAIWVQHFGGICHHCSSTFPDCVFEFHHLNPEDKDLEPSHMLHLRKEVQEKEMSKCIMLCANCHRLEHYRLKFLKERYL